MVFGSEGHAQNPTTKKPIRQAKSIYFYLYYLNYNLKYMHLIHYLAYIYSIDRKTMIYYSHRASKTAALNPRQYALT